MTDFGVATEDIHFLPEEDVQRLFIAADKLTGTNLPPSDIRLLLEIIYDAGLRVSEGLGLCKKDIDLHRKRIILTSTKGGRIRCFRCRGTGKTGQMVCSKCLGNKKVMKNVDSWVSAPLFERLTKRIELLQNSFDRLFPISRQTAHSYIKRAGELAGIEAPHIRGGDDEQMRGNLWPHLLRHSRCVHLLNKGMPLNMVQSKMRHKNLATTSVYLKVSAKDVIEKEREIEEKESLEELEKKVAQKKKELEQISH